MSDSWRELGNCWNNPAAHKMMFPERFPHRAYGRNTYDDLPGAVFCETCPVIDECYEFAQSFSAAHGIWGGLTPVQLKDARREKVIA